MPNNLSVPTQRIMLDKAISLIEQSIVKSYRNMDITQISKRDLRDLFNHIQDKIKKEAGLTETQRGDNHKLNKSMLDSKILELSNYQTQKQEEEYRQTRFNIMHNWQSCNIDTITDEELGDMHADLNSEIDKLHLTPEQNTELKKLNNRQFSKVTTNLQKANKIEKEKVFKEYKFNLKMMWHNLDGADIQELFHQVNTEIDQDENIGTEHKELLKKLNQELYSNANKDASESIKDAAAAEYEEMLSEELYRILRTG